MFNRRRRTGCFRCGHFRLRRLVLCLVAAPCVVIMTSLLYSDTMQWYKVNNERHQLPAQEQIPSVAELRKQWHQAVPLPPSLERLVKHRLRILNADEAGQISGQLPESPCPDLSTGNASRLRPSEDMVEPFVWQKMVPDSDSVYVFSAHLDRRWFPTPAVVIVGLSAEYMTIYTLPKFCQLWYRGDVTGKPHVTPARYRYSPESHGHRYTASFYTCFVRNDDVTPYAVSLVNDPCAASPPNNLLKVMTSSDYDTSATHPANFTVCVSPMFYSYDNVRQLVEMIEVNRMFGAEHFIFYNYSTGSNVTRYLDDFYRKSLGAATVVQWPLPMPVDIWPPDASVHPEVHYFGQLAALNDCLYRSLGRRSTFGVFTDLDEIIVPRRRDTWTAMLDDVTSGWHRRNGNATFPGSYVVRNTFFRTDWSRDRTFDARGDEYGSLLTLTTTEREEFVFQWGMRSKYIVWLKAAVGVGVHAADDSVPDVGHVYVDEPDALLHHYRLWIDDPVNPPRRVVDKHMHRYADTIVRRTAAVHRLLSDII